MEVRSQDPPPPRVKLNVKNGAVYMKVWGEGDTGGGGGEGGGSKEMCRMSFFLLSLYFISVLLLAGV